MCTKDPPGIAVLKRRRGTVKRRETNKQREIEGEGGRERERERPRESDGDRERKRETGSCRWSEPTRMGRKTAGRERKRRRREAYQQNRRNEPSNPKLSILLGPKIYGACTVCKASPASV